MKPFLLLLVLVLAQFVAATGIQGVPPLELRDLTITPGLEQKYSFQVHGAKEIGASVIASPEIRDYVTLLDPQPGGGPRTVSIEMDFPRDLSRIPPGIYRLSFSAHEVPEGGGQVSTAVNVGIGFILRKYADAPLLEITGVDIPSVPEGENAQFTVSVVSRTTQVIPEMAAEVTILDGKGDPLVSGSGILRELESGAQGQIRGQLPTRSLPGGIYSARALVRYSGEEDHSDAAVLRVGALSLDLADGYTRQLTFNQTNRFSFRLKSNWNAPLTNVLSTVSLLGQEKRAPPEDIASFGETGELEVYFERSLAPPGPYNGTVRVAYQERAENPLMQDSLETHTFEIPIFVDIVLPQQPAEVRQPFEVKPIHLLIAAIAVLILLNATVIYLLFRKKDKPPERIGPQ